jgi:hypothetical protein
MALPLSSLSRICRSIADFVGAELEANSNSIRVLLGNPADAARSSTPITGSICSSIWSSRAASASSLRTRRGWSACTAWSRRSASPRIR